MRRLGLAQMTRERDMVANVRITVGNEALPKNLPGFALSGMTFDPVKGYIFTGRVLDISRPMILWVSHDKVQVMDQKVVTKTLWETARRGLPVVLAFKCMELQVSKVEISESVRA